MNKAEIAEIIALQAEAKAYLEAARDKLDAASKLTQQARSEVGEHFYFDGALYSFKHSAIDYLGIQRLVGNHDWIVLERDVKVIT